MASAHTYLRFVLSVNYVKDLLVRLLSPVVIIVARVNRLKNNVVSFGFVNIDDVNEAVAVGDREREVLLAQLAVELLEFYHHLPLVHLNRPLSLQPTLQTLQVNRGYRSSTLARRYQRVESATLIHLLRSPANTALSLCAG